jgi:hypothetical protein
MARSSLQTSWLTDSAEGAPLVPPTHQRPSQGQCGGFVDRAVGHGDGVAQAARSGARAARVGGGAGGNSARRCASVGAGPHDRSPRTPELHRPPRTGIAKKKSATSVGSRSAAPAPAAGSVCWRSSLGRRAPRARETAARVVNARARGHTVSNLPAIATWTPYLAVWVLSTRRPPNRSGQTDLQQLRRGDGL